MKASPLANRLDLCGRVDDNSVRRAEHEIGCLAEQAHEHDPFEAVIDAEAKRLRPIGVWAGEPVVVVERQPSTACDRRRWLT